MKKKSVKPLAMEAPKDGGGLGIPDEMLVRIKRTMNLTWQYIADDLLVAVQEGGGGNSISRAEVIETVLDADRMRGIDDEVGRFCRNVPYAQLVKIAKTVFQYARYS